MLDAVVQIVPRFPPLFDGLGDYANTLATAMQLQSGISSRFIVTDPEWVTATGPHHDPRATAVPAGDAQALTAALDHQPATVLLHFVGYAYDGRRGQPQWLLDGLECWRKGDANRRLVIFFHELFASGPPWRKAFWLSAGQQRITAALARLSDTVLTSNQQYASWLNQHLPVARPCPVWPVLSNLGEPDHLPTFAQRQPALVVFGHPSNRARAYRQDRTGLGALCAQLGLTAVHDVGAPLPAGVVPSIDGVLAHVHGLLPLGDASHLLQHCQVGFINNAAKPLGKSGVFAAYASHGLMPVVERVYPIAEGLTPNDQVAALNQLPESSHCAVIADRAHAWYQRHGALALGRFIADTVLHLRPFAATP